MVKLFKLISGEEIIADGVKSAGSWTFKKPVHVAMTQNGIAMMPFLPLCKSNEVVIAEQNVIYDCELDQEVYNGYNAKFGSGLVLPGM